MHLRASTDLNSQFTVVRRRTRHGHGHGAEHEHERAHKYATDTIASTGASSGSVGMSARHSAVRRHEARLCKRTGRSVFAKGQRQSWTPAPCIENHALRFSSPYTLGQRVACLVGSKALRAAVLRLAVRKLGGCRTRSLCRLASAGGTRPGRRECLLICCTRFRAMLERQFVAQAQSVHTRSPAAA